MAQEHIWIEVEGDEIIDKDLEHIGDAAGRHLRRIVDSIANTSLYWLRIYVPVGESMYILRHTDRTPIKWRPGGTGGGGTYEVAIGIRRGLSEHAAYVNRGTGIYAGRGAITPRGDRRRADVIATQRPRITGRPTKRTRRRPALTFQKRGEPRRFRYSVRGQPPQHFLYNTWRQTVVYARARIITFGGGLTGQI